MAERPPIAHGDRFLRQISTYPDAIGRVITVTDARVTVDMGSWRQILTWDGSRFREYPKSTGFSRPRWSPATPADIERVETAALRDKIASRLRAENVTLTPDQIRRMWAIMEEK